MFTPQQIEELSLPKAVFGGYDMRSVDEFLVPLTEDYKALYKENAVLKSKLRILVEKLEEYRKQEATMQSAMVAAQQTADKIIQEAEQKAVRMMNEAKQTAQQNTVVTARSQDVEAETKRLNDAKATAASFIETLEKDIRHHLDLLDNLKLMDLTPKPTELQPEPAPLPEPETPKQENPEEIAEEIEQNLEKLVGSEDDDKHATKVIRGLHPESITAKFGQLQFGKNYNPNQSNYTETIAVIRTSNGAAAFSENCRLVQGSKLLAVKIPLELAR